MLGKIPFHAGLCDYVICANQRCVRHIIFIGLNGSVHVELSHMRYDYIGYIYFFPWYRSEWVPILCRAQKNFEAQYGQCDALISKTFKNCFAYCIAMRVYCVETGLQLPSPHLMAHNDFACTLRGDFNSTIRRFE